MFKLFICVVIMIFLSLAGCGVRYNWVPQSDEPGPPNVEYQGTGISNPDSNL
jgi:hypothetical protein